jgi:hypothetical protein
MGIRKGRGHRNMLPPDIGFRRPTAPKGRNMIAQGRAQRRQPQSDALGMVGIQHGSPERAKYPRGPSTILPFVAPFQGLIRLSNLSSRALPWADMLRHFVATRRTFARRLVSECGRSGSDPNRPTRRFPCGRNPVGGSVPNGRPSPAGGWAQANRIRFWPGNGWPVEGSSRRPELNSVCLTPRVVAAFH